MAAFDMPAECCPEAEGSFDTDFEEGVLLADELGGIAYKEEKKLKQE